MGKILFVLTVALSMLGCTDSGVQGGSVFSSYKGLEGATALSPTSIQLNWSLDKKYSQYRIYQNGGASPIDSEQFSTHVVKSLQPNTTYVFLVSGFSEANQEEVISGTSLTAMTFKSFSGLPEGGLTLKSATDVDLTWSMADKSIEYKIYKKEQSGTWDFTTALSNVTNDNRYSAVSLTAGHSYCFYITANYLDGTSEPAATVELANANGRCITMTSSIPSLPSINVGSVSPGQFPWFWASSGDPTYKIDIYDLLTDTIVASRTGNGTFRSFHKENVGTKQYYAKVISTDGLANVPVNISGGVSPKATNIRAPNEATPLFPPLLQSGKGYQRLGSDIVMGDFNCDGLMDVAVSMSAAVTSDTTQHFSNNGAVIIYYQYDPPPYIDGGGNPVDPLPYLVTDVTPSITNVYPNPLIITYPVNSNNTNLGKQLAVGNVNNDCYLLDGGSSLKGQCDALYTAETTQVRKNKIHACQDLAIGASDGGVYVLFGDSALGLVAGSGTSTYGVDESTCDPTSQSCRPVRMRTPTGYTSSTFGNALTFGDYNNDGYDELAVSATKTATSFTDVLIYRGSSLGLMASSNTSNHVSIDASAIPIGNTYNSAILISELFASSLGTAYNSRTCKNGLPAGYTYRPGAPPIRKGYDFTKCDDLVIGIPGRSGGRGSIMTCKASINLAIDPDPQRIVGWSCKEHYPTELDGTTSNYGWSILGVPNQIGYPLYGINASLPANAVPDVGGALFVGAPLASVSGLSKAGKVYGYYITPYATDSTLGGINGGIQLILQNGDSGSGHNVTAVNTVACDKLNRNVQNSINTALFHCENQLIYSSPPKAGARFGYSLSSLPSRTLDDDTSLAMPFLAVGSPYKDSTTAVETGAFYLYRGDVSNFGVETGSGSPVTITSNVYNYDNRLDYACTQNCTWFSGGISPYGPTILYPQNLAAKSHFGLSRAAGGSFNGDGDGDFIAGAPDSKTPVTGNGGLFGFISKSGFGSTETVPEISINANLSLEGGYHFEQAKVVGDINNDGYSDVATHVYSNGSWVLVLYYGSSNGLITTPAPSATPGPTQPLLLSSTSDVDLAKYFYKAGDLNGDGYDDIFLNGGSASYIYYGSQSGLISQVEPSISPVGKNPLKLGVYKSVRSLTFYPSMHPSNYYVSQTYDSTTFGVAIGDYNKDGFGDIAIRLPTSSLSPALSAQGSLDFSATNYGRVAIIYGSLTGPVTNKLTGEILLQNPDGSEADVVALDPCKPAQVPACKVQLISSPINGALKGVKFGFGLATIIGQGTATSDNQDSLLVGDPEYDTKNGIVYYFKGGTTGLESTPTQILTPRDTASGFGFDISELGDVNGDQYTDVAIAAPFTTTKNALYVFYGQAVGGKNAFYGASNLGATDYWNAPAIVNNNEFLDVTKPRPQVLRPSTVGVSASGSTDQFPMGLSSVGDFNQDGYSDLMVASPNADSTVNGTVLVAGYGVVYFGSASGIQSKDKNLSVNPRCFGGTSAVCEPFQFFIPNATDYESFAISNQSSGDINGDGLIDIVIGGFGRSLPTGNSYATGVIYVLY